MYLGPIFIFIFNYIFLSCLRLLMVKEFVLSLEDMKNASRSKYLLDWKGLFFILCAEQSDKATIMYSIFRINWKFHIGIGFHFNMNTLNRESEGWIRGNIYFVQNTRSVILVFQKISSKIFSGIDAE